MLLTPHRAGQAPCTLGNPHCPAPHPCLPLGERPHEPDGETRRTRTVASPAAAGFSKTRHSVPRRRTQPVMRFGFPWSGHQSRSVSHVPVRGSKTRIQEPRRSLRLEDEARRPANTVSVVASPSGAGAGAPAGGSETRVPKDQHAECRCPHTGTTPFQDRSPGSDPFRPLLPAACTYPKARCQLAKIRCENAFAYERYFQEHAIFFQ